MTQAIGILELTSIARGMELGDVMLKSANVQLLLCRTLCPGKFLLMLGGDVGAVQQAIAAGTARAGEMLVDSLVLANIHPSVLPAISGLNVVGQRQAAGIVETWSVAACISAADHAVKRKYIGPKSKIARKFGEAIYGADKVLEKRNFPPYGRTSYRLSL